VLVESVKFTSLLETMFCAITDVPTIRAAATKRERRVFISLNL
jgi:hypothetical protein